MNKISIVLNDSWLSLQNGFEWNNIPRLSIITGVNGIGKSHLVRLFKNEINVERNQYSTMQATLPISADKMLKRNWKIVDSETGEDYTLVIPKKGENLSFGGFIEYFNNMSKRLGVLENLKTQMQNSLSYKQNLVNKLQSMSICPEYYSLQEQIKQQNEGIKYYEDQIAQTKIFPYEQELNRISTILGKEFEKITETEARLCASHSFNHITEFDDFKNYVSEERDEFKSRCALLVEQKNAKKFEEVSKEQQVYQKINELFKKFGFDYFEMLNPFPEDRSCNGEILFEGKKGEKIGYWDLSDGEKMIVKFIIWAMAKDVRGNRINTMILDEPDAHLHPKMCKMMVAILQEISNAIELGGSNVRVIITTHSPSTVAFAPEGSLFVMEKDIDNNKFIIPTNTQTALNILSEGILTFDQVSEKISYVNDSKAKNILFVEGKTDVKHIKAALKAFDKELNIDIVDMHDADTLSKFIKSCPSGILNGKRMIALFDNDDEGRRAYNNIKGNENGNIKQITAIQCGNNSFAILIPLYGDLRDYCPIEFLYSKSVLEEFGMLQKLSDNEFFTKSKYSSSVEIKDCLEEYEKGESLNLYKVSSVSSKNEFANHALNKFTLEHFTGFKPLIELIEKVITLQW